MGRQIAAVILALSLTGCGSTMLANSSYCRLSPKPFKPSARAAKHFTQRDKDWVTINNERHELICSD